MAGAARSRDWQTGAATTYSAFDAKAEAVAALAAAGVPVDRLSVLPPADPWFHPGRSGRLALGAKMVLASFGELHPRVAATRDPVAVAEIYLDAIPAARSAKRTRPVFTPPPLQAVTRDFAFVVAADLPAETLLRSVRGADKVAITHVALFDRFPLDDKVSLAVTVTLQPVERSFTDADIDTISAKIVAAAAKVGGVLRG